MTRIVVALLCALAVGGGLVADEDNRPNVLFIAVDDLNDWTGCLGGHPQAYTPNLDSLAARGVLFTRAYCAAPACNPSRVALMTGIAPYRSGIYHNPMPWRPVLPDAVTLAQHFMQNGYKVMGSGKIFHGAYPDPASWEIYWPSKTRTRPSDPLPPMRPLNGIPNTGHFDWGPLDVDDTAMGDYQVVRWVCERLMEEHDRPFFLACGIFRPHLPWYVPRKYFERFPLEDIQLPVVKEDDLEDIPPAGVKMARPQGDHRKVLQYKQWKNAVQGYLASIYFMDTLLGQLIDTLDRSPYANNTIVVLWSDHGWHLGEKQHWRKFALWEEATRVPLIFVVPEGISRLVPGGTPSGGRCGRTVSLLDIYPTLAELCGLPPRPGLDGRSLVRLLRDPNADWSRPAITTHGYKNHAVRTERWRYIRYADGSEELYDHEKDPYEWNNLAGNPDYARIKEELARWLPASDAPPAPTEQELRKQRRRATGSE